MPGKTNAVVQAGKAMTTAAAAVASIPETSRVIASELQSDRTAHLHRRL